MGLCRSDGVGLDKRGDSLFKFSDALLLRDMVCELEAGVCPQDVCYKRYQTDAGYNSFI